ncbi:RDD family protein [Alicyclobacillus mengziensis]|uniref:RDD family protein n=1 Tax=Alicyclobacillus mengziensis TaxID=2931921 RepID=A0A9X7VWL7_9BACL|nr:RDD family protein [Alicyclobacillus mengziensis]QSO46421.1 RDD family protein [Alicyclobacillus mengziensis]
MLDNNLNVHTPEQVRLKLRLAGIGSRAVAQVIDLLILAVVYALFTVSEVMWQWLNVFGRATSYLVGAAVVISFLIFWGYFIALETALSGQTLGKRVMKIRAVGRDGRPLSFYAAAIRNLLRLVDFLPIGYLVGMIVTVIDGQERRLGDLAAGSVVVQDRMESFWQYSSSLGVQDSGAPRNEPGVVADGGTARMADGGSERVIVSVPKSPLQIEMDMPLPGEWTQFLKDLGPRLRGLSKRRREELLPQVWHNFTALAEVSLHPATANKGTSRDEKGRTSVVPNEQEPRETPVFVTDVTIPDIERFLAAVSRQLRGRRRGRKLR